jgi:hypothetical protein
MTDSVQRVQERPMILHEVWEELGTPRHDVLNCVWADRSEQLKPSLPRTARARRGRNG